LILKVVLVSLTFREVQEWVERFERARGWADRPPEEKFICLQEEVGELASALRSVWHKTSELMKRGKEPEKARKTALRLCSSAVAEEIVDCIIYLLSIANKFRTDLRPHLKDKMKVSEERKWPTEHALKTGFK